MLRIMNNVLIERINLLLEKSGMTAQRLSINATGAKDTVRKILDGSTKNPRTDTIAKIAAVLETSQQYLLGESDDPSQRPIGPARGNGSAHAPELPPKNQMPLDVPVMGTAAGSFTRGAFAFEGGVVDYVRRPPALVGARDIYALYVEGSSMEPQYFPGDLIYINPHRPPKTGDIVVVQCKNSEHSPEEASLGIFKKKTERAVTIGKRNPIADIDLNRDLVKDIHRVLTVNELFGI